MNTLALLTFASQAACAFKPPASPPPLAVARGPARAVEVPGDRVVIGVLAGSAYDPRGREGLAAATARALARTAGADVEVGPEVVTFSGPRDSLVALGGALAAPPAAASPVTALTDTRDPAGTPTAPADCRALAEDAWDAWVFGGHPYGHPVAGRTSVLPTLTEEEARGFHALRYVRGAAIVGLPGGGSAGAALDGFPPALSPSPTPAPLGPVPEATVLVVRADVPAPCAAVGHRLPYPSPEPLRAALDLARASWGAPAEALRREARALLSTDLPAGDPAAVSDVSVRFGALAAQGLDDAAFAAARDALAATRTPDTEARDRVGRALLGLAPRVDPDRATVNRLLADALDPGAVRVVVVTSDTRSFEGLDGANVQPVVDAQEIFR